MSEQARLQELEDIQAITRLKARYVHAADGGWTDKPPHDAEGVASLFVPDGVWDGGRFGRGEGHDGIRAYFQGAIETTPMVFHHTSSPDIQVDGDTATGSWHVVVPMIQAGVSSVLVGIYHDEFVRTAEGWKFKRLRFQPANMIDLPSSWKPF